MDASSLLASIIVSVFNEEDSLPFVLSEIVRHCGTNTEIIIVDDGSTDSSAEFAALFAAGHEGGIPVKIVSHGIRCGLGASLLTGAIHASGEYLLWVDGDGQHRGEDVGRVLHELRNGKETLDYVIGVRNRGEGSPVVRRPGKAVLSFFADRCAGRHLPDFNSGLRAIRKSIFLSWVHLYPKGFGTSTATSILLAAGGYAGKEIPIRVRHRQGGKSLVRQVRDGFRTLGLIFRLGRFIQSLSQKKS